jgi:hypothetical protein
VKYIDLAESVKLSRTFYSLRAVSKISTGATKFFWKCSLVKAVEMLLWFSRFLYSCKQLKIFSPEAWRLFYSKHFKGSLQHSVKMPFLKISLLNDFTTLSVSSVLSNDSMEILNFLNASLIK